VTSEQQAWLDAAARVPLLTQQEEIILGRQVQAAIGEQDPQILRRARRAKERLATANLRLVYRIAERYRRAVPASGFMDLLQAGAEGVMHAAGKFDPSRGIKFSTYSAWWIRERIQDELAKNSRTIRAPTTITGKLRRLPGVRQQLTMALGRLPTVEELATELMLSPAEVCIELQRANGLISLDSPVKAGAPHTGCVTVGALLATPAEDEDDQLVLLRQGMARLPEVQRRLLDAAYLPGEPTLAQQARVEGLSIRQAKEQVKRGLEQLQVLREIPKPKQLHLPLQLLLGPSIQQRRRSGHRRKRRLRRCFMYHQLEFQLGPVEISLTVQSYIPGPIGSSSSSAA
jgi:RNA polymerase sigma factor (sigma-70 family)